MTESFRIKSPSVIHETIDDEVVVIHMLKGSYYNLEGSATRIWSRLVASTSFGAIVREFESLFDVGVVDVEESVTRFLDELEREDLIERVSEVLSPNPENVGGVVSPGNGTERFIPPVITKYTDMQDLLLLDPIHDVNQKGWPIQESKGK